MHFAKRVLDSMVEIRQLVQFMFLCHLSMGFLQIFFVSLIYKLWKLVEGVVAVNWVSYHSPTWSVNHSVDCRHSFVGNPAGQGIS